MSEPTPVSGETVTLEASDGFKLGAYLARAEAPAKGGIVILQEIFGVTDQLKTLADSWARDGYDAIVPAFYDRFQPDTVYPFEDIENARKTGLGLDPEKVALDAEAALMAVDSGKGVSVIGFCWGGGHAFRLACRLNLTGAVAYYGTALKMHMEKNPDGPKCPMLFHFGETDDHTPADVIDAVKAAVPSATVHIYAAGHAFANDVRASYVPDAATTARARTLEFLNSHHGG